MHELGREKHTFLKKDLILKFPLKFSMNFNRPLAHKLLGEFTTIKEVTQGKISVNLFIKAHQAEHKS